MKVVYLPVEILTRELDSRVELVKALPDCIVVVGQSWEILRNAEKLPHGVILFKTVNRIQGSNMMSWKLAGHTVCALDEEALIAKGASALDSAVSRLAMSNCDYFLAHNQEQLNVIQSTYFLDGRVVGNQRLDLCRGESFEPEAAALREKHGPFVLINTNFGSINSHWGGYEGSRNIAKQAGMIDTPAQDYEFKAMAAWEHRNMTEVYSLINKLSDLGIKIILRPHPGENPSVWEDISEIIVVTGTSPLPYIAASEMVFATSCTTSLEAAIMGKQSVNLSPARAPIEQICGEVNVTVRSAEEAVDAMDRGVEMSEYTKLAREMFPSGATDKIADVLRSIGPTVSETVTFNIDPIERTDLQRVKFTLDMEQAWRKLGQCSKLADSLYIKRPEAA